MDHGFWSVSWCSVFQCCCVQVLGFAWWIEPVCTYSEIWNAATTHNISCMSVPFQISVWLEVCFKFWASLFLWKCHRREKPRQRLRQRQRVRLPLRKETGASNMRWWKRAWRLKQTLSQATDLFLIWFGCVVLFVSLYLSIKQKNIIRFSRHLVCRGESSFAEELCQSGSFGSGE